MKKIFSKHYQIESPWFQIDNKLRILHLSDLHIKERTRLDYVYKTIENYQPNLAVLTGDYVCYDTDSLHRVTEFLLKIKIPKFATLGNHDHWTDPGAVINSLHEGGCIVLQNDSAIFKHTGGEIFLVGIDDRVTGNDRVDEAFNEVPAGKTCIVLSHVGDVIEDIKNHKPAIILAGHTHAGQIKIPYLTKRLLNAYGLKYHHGFYQYKEKLVYVSSGMGESVPLRWRSPQEICTFDFTYSSNPSYKLIESGLVT